MCLLGPLWDPWPELINFEIDHKKLNYAKLITDFECLSTKNFDTVKVKIKSENLAFGYNVDSEIKNLSTTAGEECVILYGSTSIGNVPPGTAVFLPYDGNSDVNITCASAGATQQIEFLHVYEDTTY